MADNCFQLKGGMVPMPVLELQQFEAAAFSDQLAETVQQAPMFFQQTPVIISLDKLAEGSDPDLPYIDACCRKYGMHPVALRGQEQHRPWAQAANLAFLPSSGNRSEAKTEKVPEPPKTEPAPEPQVEVRTVIEEKLVSRPSKVVTQPVRSGQQVYAQGADLIVLAQVSEGAEVLADGHIHVYGPLRGRALAGVQGDDSARIFCQSLEAELVSIAGQFKLSDDLQEGAWKQSAQVYCQDDALHVAAL